MFKKHFFKILLGIVFSAVLIWLTLRQIDFHKSLELIKNANYYLLIPGVIIYALTYFLRSLRFYFMLRPIKKTRVFENFPYTMLGFFMNNIIPLRLGEVIRAKVTGERLGISRSAALGAIVIERLLDMIVFVLFFFLIMIVLPFPEFIKKSFYLSTIVFGGALLVLFVISKNDKKSLELVNKIPMPAKIKNYVAEIFEKFTGGLAMLKKPALFSVSFLFSIIAWIAESSFLVITAYSCGINISIVGGIFVVIIIGIGAILPTAPGYIGAFEFMGVTAFSVLGVDKDSAFACIAIYHFLQIIVIFTLGFASVLKAKISFIDLFKFENGRIEDTRAGEQ
ncbi:MAG: flippase-like domain-containing protein [Endomicrobium sp.]|jgi:uncharacterized protein (TIRG00374 family)|nr:flippase-like domain-containing protein [Endomicrobium sp.]